MAVAGGCGHDACVFQPWIVLLTASWVLLSWRASQGGVGGRRALGTTLALACLLALPLLPAAARWADLGWAVGATWWDAQEILWLRQENLLKPKGP